MSLAMYLGASIGIMESVLYSIDILNSGVFKTGAHYIDIQYALVATSCTWWWHTSSWPSSPWANHDMNPSSLKPWAPCFHNVQGRVLQMAELHSSVAWQPIDNYAYVCNCCWLWMHGSGAGPAPIRFANNRQIVLQCNQVERLLSH